MCEIFFQSVQKKREEKRIEDEQAVKAQKWKLPVCYDDDDDEEGYNFLTDNIISELPSYLQSHLLNPLTLSVWGIPAPKSDEFIKSCVENLVPNPSESKGENGCDVPAGFTIFSNVLFDDDYDSDSNQHSFNAESDLIESMPNHDSSIIISSKIDSLFDEFADELTLLKSIPPGIDETDCHPEKEICFTKRLYDSFMEEIDLPFNPDDPMPPSIEDDDDDSEGDTLFLERLLHDDPIPLPNTFDFPNVIRVFLPFFTYPVTSSILLSSGSKDTIFDPGIS
nr:hypothetical protein [Tanacetum cinerariifolium]